MSEPIARYRPSRQFLWACFVALAITAFSGWVALRFEYAWIAAGLALLSAIVLFLMALTPTVEIHESHLRYGSRSIPWSHIRRLDRATLVPLTVRMRLADGTQATLFYAGDPEAANHLLRHLRRLAREALIDGVPHKQFWGEPAHHPNRKQPPSPRYPLMLPEDEAEVERLFHRLKNGGNLDQPTPRGSRPKGYKEDE